MDSYGRWDETSEPRGWAADVEVDRHLLDAVETGEMPALLAYARDHDGNPHPTLAEVDELLGFALREAEYLDHDQRYDVETGVARLRAQLAAVPARLVRAA